MIRLPTRIGAVLRFAAVVAVMGPALSACWVEERPASAAETETAQNAQGERTGPVEIERIYPEGVARLPVFTPAVRVGDLIFLSGAIGTVGNELRLIEGGVGPETRQTLENLETVIEAAGGTLADMVKCTVFLADINDYAAMNEVYLEFFGDNPPARSAMAGSGLALGALVEIECIARDPAG